MKHFHIYGIFCWLLCLVACSQEKFAPQPAETKVPVTLHIGVPDMVDSGQQTRYIAPLDPNVENTIANLWLIQYDQEGNLVDTILINEKRMGVVSTSHIITAKLTPRTNSTIVAIANMMDIPNKTNWPNDEHYQWKPKFKDMQKEQYESNLSDAEYEEKRGVIHHLIMAGDVVIPLIEENTPIQLNVMLVRLTSRFRVSVKGAIGTQFTDVKLQIVNSPSKMCLYPIKNLYCEHLNYKEQEVVSGNSNYLRTDEPVGPFYFYSDEDLAETPEEQPDDSRIVKLKITANESGKSYTQTIKVSPTGHNYRNTTYTMELTLKKPTKATSDNGGWVEVEYR